MRFHRFDIETDGLYSLVWIDGHLFDPLGGNIEYLLDGSKKEPNIHRRWAYPFDCAISSSPYSIYYEKSGTKAILLKNGELLRELNRSFYHARDYGYPITFMELPNGEKGIIHCPQDYNILDIENAETGEILTRRPNNATDIFHSRLQVSPDNRWLFSNGWVWQPWNIGCLYDLQEAISNPNHLDGDGIKTPLTSTGQWEIENAVFGQNLIVACLNEDGKFKLGILTLDKMDLTLYPLSKPTGLLMFVESNYIVAFFEFPRIIDIRTGEIVLELNDIKTFPERIQPSVSFSKYHQPLIAIDPINRQFAIGKEKSITVIQLY